MATSTKAEADEALAVLRVALQHSPDSGPNHAAESARDRAIEILGRLPADADPFVLERLEEAFAAARRKDGADEAEVCGTIVTAVAQRRSPGAAGILRRMVFESACPLWLPRNVVWLMSKWDPAGFATILREAVASRLDEYVRSAAAESLVQSRLATEREIDEFFRDRDHSVRKLALRGLATSATPDAIIRLSEVALREKDERLRAQAWSLLGNIGAAPRLAPGPSGCC